MRDQPFYVYIITNKRNGTLYTGVTNDLERRMFEHKRKLNDGFAKQYGLNILVFIEQFEFIADAIYRETQIKGWTRARKLKLIEAENPRWDDLSKDWEMDFTLDR